MSLCVHIHVLKKLKGKFLLFILQQGYINMISTQNLTQINIKIASSLGKIIPCVYHFTSQGKMWQSAARASFVQINANLTKKNAVQLSQKQQQKQADAIVVAVDVQSKYRHACCHT